MQSDRSRRSSLKALSAAGLAGLTGLGVSPRVRAQAWPSKPIRFFVGFAPGGTTDPYARVFGEYMTQKLGQPVVVENRVGANGFISLEALARAPADGYTIGVTTSTSVWGSRALYRKLPFDADRDFVPISLLPVGPLVFAVPTTSPANSVKEWIELARKTPVSMASYGAASVPHLLTQELNQNHGAKVTVVHYKGEGPMWPDVSTNVVQAGVGSYVAISPHLARGALKVLGTFGRERNPKLPNVKSFIDQGYDAQLFGLDGCLVVLAPAKTPPEIIAKFSEMFVEGADSPKALSLRDAFAIEAKPTSAAVAGERWRKEMPIWVKLSEALDIKLD